MAKIRIDQVHDLMAKYALERGAAVFDSVECVLKSGRKFRYQFRDYPFGPDTTPEQAEALARRILADKYCYCQWDRDHPQNDSEEDIVEVIRRFIMDWVTRMQRVRAAQSVQPSGAPSQSSQVASSDTPRVFASWGIFAGRELVEEFPYRERVAAEQRLADLLAQKPGQFRLQQIRRTQ